MLFIKLLSYNNFVIIFSMMLIRFFLFFISCLSFFVLFGKPDRVVHAQAPTPKTFNWKSVEEEAAWLQPLSCLENQTIKICFDDRFGGTIVSLYNKRTAPTRNLVLPDRGGAFQLDVRSGDPINACPSKSIGWGKVWNPTQSGCAACFLDQAGKWISVGGDTSGTLLPPTYTAQSRLRNYFHHNANDCHAGLPYTNTGQVAEDINLLMQATMQNEYVQVTWDVEHTGDHRHSTLGYGTGNATRYHQELPTFYLADDRHVGPANTDDCFTVFVENASGNITSHRTNCGTNGSTVYDNNWNSWYSIINPNNPNEKITMANNVSMVDNRKAKLGQRNYFGQVIFDDTGIQFTNLNYFDIMPRQRFRVTTYVFPYLYNEQLPSGQTVLDFIREKQRSNATGFLSKTQTYCRQVKGWSSDVQFSMNVNSILIYDNEGIIADVPANQFWDATVNNHGFSLLHRFEEGTHVVRTLGKDPTTGNYTELNDSPFTFSCIDGDVTKDLIVNASDVTRFTQTYGADDCNDQADLDVDCHTNGFDYQIIHAAL
ncbi:hypothetical protein HY468_01570 [Candidatus Roizmanbacteria bacterium]|nr:hypothetical protein [Candidatus Roizmanbacteria bacterium]